MKKLSVVLLVVATVMGGLAYQQHVAYRKADAARFTLNENGTVNVQLFGPGVRKTTSAKTLRNALIAACALSAVGGIVGLIASLKRREGTPE